MKNLIHYLFVLSIAVSYAQVGIGTTTPEGTLDVVSSNDTGLVIPRVSAVENVTDGQGNPPVDGTLVYDISQEAVCIFINGKWLCGTFNQQGIGGWSDGNPPYETSQTYIKASNTGNGDEFGTSLTLSDDGLTLAVGAPEEDVFSNSGAVYIYRKVAGAWTFEAVVRGSNNATNDFFGYSVSLNSNGNTLAVSAPFKTSNRGYVYVFERTGGIWTEQTNFLASNHDPGDLFGLSISLDNSGNTLVIGAYLEDSNAIGVNGDQNDDSLSSAGAAYVYARSGGIWTQEAYLKASNTNAGDQFGRSVSISGDGTYISIGAVGEDSNATGANGNESDNTASDSGAAYIFNKSGGVWSQQAYIKASNTDIGDAFGTAVAMDYAGQKIVITAQRENSNAIGVNGIETNNLGGFSGAAYVFSRTGSVWAQESYLKASNTEPNDTFGISASISGDGNHIIIGAQNEDSNAVGINGNFNDNSAFSSGAAYTYSFDGTSWSILAYIKATNTETNDQFGYAVTIDSTGNTIGVSAVLEDSIATGVGGDQTNNATFNSGAVYLYDN